MKTTLIESDGWIFEVEAEAVEASLKAVNKDTLCAYSIEYLDDNGDWSCDWDELLRTVLEDMLATRRLRVVDHEAGTGIVLDYL